MNCTSTEVQTVLVEGLYLPVKPTRAERTCRALVDCLIEDCRMSLVAMSRRTGVPVSTLHDAMKRIRRDYEFDLIVRRKHVS